MTLLSKKSVTSWVDEINWTSALKEGYVRFEHESREYLFPVIGGFLEVPNCPYVTTLTTLVNKTSKEAAKQFNALLLKIIAEINKSYFKMMYGLLREPVYIAPDMEMNYRVIPGHEIEDCSRFLEDCEWDDIPDISHNIVYGPDVTQITPGRQVIYVLGAEPSFVEWKTGVNFSGDFGELLLDSLRQNIPDNVDPYIYVANLLRIYNCPKSLKTKATRDFSPLVFLELGVLAPDHIICLGSQALKLFTKKTQTVVREKPESYTYKVIGSGGLIHTKTALVHVLPLGALQSFSENRLFQNLIKRTCTQIFLGTTPETPKIEYKRIDSPEDLNTYLKPVYDKAKTLSVHIAFDLEWNGRFPGDGNSYIRTINIAHDANEQTDTAVVVLTAPGGEWIFKGTKEDLQTSLNPIFDVNNNIQVVGHNFIADVPYLEHLGIPAKQKFLFPENLDASDPDYPGVFDTIIAYHAVDECGQFGLEKAARIWLDFPDWSQELAKYLKEIGKDDGYGEIPEEILLPYAATDAYITLELAKALRPCLSQDHFRNNCWKPYWINLRAQPAFLEMFETGVQIDTDRALSLAEVYNEVREKLIEEFRQEICWPTFNIQSYPQCVELLYGEKYTGKAAVRPEGATSFCLDPIKTTDGKEWDDSCIPGKVSPSTDLDTLNNLAVKEPRIRTLRDIRVLNQITKTILPVQEEGDEEAGGILGFICSDGKIHPSYSALKETRRCSSSRPNLQNLPNSEEDSYKAILGEKYIAPIRSIIVAPAGHTLVEIDYSGAELLLIGVAANDKNLIEDYYRSTLPDDDPNKLDIHSNIAVLAFGLDCPPTKAGLKSIGKAHYRMAAKQIIFGLNYGRGVKSCYFQLVTEGVDVEERDVYQVVDTIYRRYDKVKELQDAAKSRVHTHRWLANCFGSYRRFYLTRAKDAVAKMEREAMNFICQSGVADAISTAMYNFYTHPTRKEINYKFSMHNHDALLFVVPDQHVERFVNETVHQCMKEGVKFQSCTLDGKPRPNSPWYQFELEAKTGKRWAG